MAVTKYIFVTGGVASSLGKGTISASIGKLLQSRGYKVTIQKYDPYININAGILDANEQGECYVTVDGHEANRDLGHYERFLDVEMTTANNVTTGQIYKSVIDKERHGEFMGKTIQVIPHITNEIKQNIKMLGEQYGYDFVITDIGGTVGDIESLPYLESIRQLKWEMPDDTLFIHLTYVPYLSAAQELKTKPTQHSVKELQSAGIQPDILVLRTEHPLTDDMRRKVALFCNVNEVAVIPSSYVPCIYQIPVLLQEQHIDEIILSKFGMKPAQEANLESWKAFLELRDAATEEVEIALVGKYALRDAFKSIAESLSLAATYNHRKLNLKFIHSETLDQTNAAELLKEAKGIVIGPGEKARGVEGLIAAARYGREHDVPTFGICYGMQWMVVEFARNVLGLEDASSAEINPLAPHKVIDLMEEEKLQADIDGNLRLGSFECDLTPGSKAALAYGKTTVKERHRHHYELNSQYKEALEKGGMMCTGINPRTGLTEVVEIPALRWYTGVQFHPEYQSTVLRPHPLFIAFIKAAITKK